MEKQNITSETREKQKELVTSSEKLKVEVPEIVSVKEFAAILKLPVARVMAQLIKNGVMATINESIDYDTAAVVGDDLGYEVLKKASERISLVPQEEEQAKLEPRPPVVTIMGHVDHGKTTLLDKIRESDVASKEAGGITQHIGAYQVVVKQGKKKRLITFLDTPGHEAFTAMRAHGANITDIVVLVVAADDGVKPQTIEAYDHAKAANVPVIVAITKVDKPEADPIRTMQELTALGLQPEEWGGKTVTVQVSAKTGKGVLELLEMILLVADMAKLEARSEGKSQGIVIESHLDPGLGPVATVLVQQGKLDVGDAVAIGEVFGKVKTMKDFAGRRVVSALPSTPVQISGLSGVPNFGELVVEFDNESEAKAAAQEMLRERSVKRIKKQVMGLGELSEAVRAGKLKELKLVIKADVQGSLEAIRNTLSKLGSGEVRVKIVADGVGSVSESDVALAQASDALVVGFRVPILPSARAKAEVEKVKITQYDVIYQLSDDIYSALEGLLEPEVVEVETGEGEVLQVFLSQKKYKIIGAKIIKGEIIKGTVARVLRDEKLLGEGRITTLKVVKEDVEKVEKGAECGIGLEIDFKLKPGDKLKFIKFEEKLKKI